MDPMTIAMIASTAAELFGGEAPPPPQLAGQMNIDKTTGTDKYNETIRSLNEGNRRERLFAPGSEPETGSLAPSLLQAGSKDYSQTGSGPQGNIMGMDQGGGGGGGEGGGGFNMDNALQYAALAAQLGSMFAPPPPPAPPRAGGGMNINAQPYTLRMMGGR
jgi:hypothetical protein